MSEVKRYTVHVTEMLLLATEDRPTYNENWKDMVLSSDYDALKARLAIAERALREITRIGPLGVDTYPECYRLIQEIARPFAAETKGDVDG